MAEGILKSIDEKMEVYSAGTKPASRVHPFAVRVMQEIGIDLSGNNPKQVEPFLSQTFDYVITVCDHAKEFCPLFIGRVNKQLHIGFDDPAEAKGSKNDKLAVFRRVREEIQRDFEQFYRKYIEE